MGFGSWLKEIFGEWWATLVLSLSCKDLKVPLVSILFTLCTPLHPSPFHRSPHVSVPLCFVLPSPTPLVSCSLCYTLCVSSYTSLHIVY